jgi:hypothetical protein
MAEDFRKQLKPYFSAKSEPVLIRIPAIKYLYVEGKGDPAKGREFQQAISALYTLIYTLKFSLKRASRPREVPVMPLQALWWMAGGRKFSTRAPRSAWRWRAMLAVPGFVTPAMVEKARKEAFARKPLPTLKKLKLERWREGLCAQVLHVGPYAAEMPTIDRLHAFLKDKGYRPKGRHHEIYLSDPGRTAQRKLKTIIRQPVT